MRMMYRSILALIAAGALVAVVRVLPIDEWLVRIVDGVRDAGAIGIALYATIYVAATLLMLPGSVLTAGAGFVYGPLWGTILVSPVSVLAATLAFVLGRTVASDWVARRLAAAPRFSAVYDAVGRSGFRIVLLLRLSPLFPFNLLNYGLGLTRVRLRDYALASFLGMLPGTVLYVYLGSVVSNASEVLGGRSSEAGTLQNTLYWVGLAATVAVAVLVTRIARRALDQTIDLDAIASAPRTAPTDTTSDEVRR